MNDGLSLLHASELDGAIDLQNAWADPTLDVPVLQPALHRKLSRKLDRLRESSNIASLLDWVPAGGRGFGQTRLLSLLRRESYVRRIHFVLVHITGVHDYWSAVLGGFLQMLEQNRADGTTRCAALLEDLLALPGPLELLQDFNASLRTADPAKLAKLTAVFSNTLARYTATPTTSQRDVLRALIALNSEDQATAGVGMTWLQGRTIEQWERRTLGFAQAQMSERQIIEGLSWWMSLVAPTVLVVAQLDPVVTQLNLAAHASAHTAEEPTAWDEMVAMRSTIEDIGCGLASLQHVTRRTLILVCCRETNWESLAHCM